ncbi:hypothetical protein TpMuguga_02g02315 [Theileria parva strain Muguga]|uniref:uncharacterized protein n=1 Tax=Theileria parva strain Muguga TaxID=333668 RepID=UPI001C61CE97|nr:uncharacterized protein TpMuguga_02g02315 [Theileria parva strain Muguga]KAF5153673.1 hypothetical protein TpMuguga_02g02315 [Theileria parva strain Muguga]
MCTDLRERFDREIKEWNEIKLVIKINFRALEILLQKFLLFNISHSSNGTNEDLTDYIFNSYTNTIEDMDVELEGLDNIPKDNNDEINKKVSYDAVEGSILINLLIVNKPDVIKIYLQKQSNKILEIKCEIKKLLKSYQDKNLRKIDKIYEESQILYNHYRNINTEPVSTEPTTVMELIKSVESHYKDIKEEINVINEFCVNLDVYPKDEDEIKKNLHFLQNLNIL